MKICTLLNALVNAAEKGANIARIIRSESSLLNLLVQEKKGDQKNERFIHDFKTLADVLVQELVRYDLSQQCPGISDSIYGEESNKFTNTLGESIIVKIQENAEKTQALLATVLDDNEQASHILSEVIHTEVTLADTCTTEHLDQDIHLDNLGVWIDPIDSTAQYIQGDIGKEDSAGLVSEGLQCVTVLIGVYDKTTGLPVIGVVNQPFFSLGDDERSWRGKTTWGVCVGDIRANSLPDCPTKPQHSPLTMLISSSESQHVQDALSHDFILRHIAGAGYKLLAVSQGLADTYMLTRNSIFKWDCCGPHAILRSVGGGIVNYSEVHEFVKQNRQECDFTKFMQIRYHIPDQAELTGAQRWCNDGGIIAYRSVKVLESMAESICKL